MRQAETSTSPTPVPKTTRTLPLSPQTRRAFFQRLVIGLLLALAAFFGFQAIHASREPATEKVTFRSSPDVRFINGVPFRPIENYEPCDRVLGENPLLTAKDRAGFGREPDPMTWKLLYVLAPKVDGSWAETKMVQPPEWLEEHKPEVGKTVPISVPECGIAGMAEVLSIGPCRPVKPGKGPVVLATFRHHVASTVNVYISGVAEPVGCTGNHPFWSVDRQGFVRADELREGERLDGFGPDARVERVALDGQPQEVFSILVQGEHVYRVSEAGVLVHNARPCPYKDLDPGRPGDFIPIKELAESATTRAPATTASRAAEAGVKLTGRGSKVLKDPALRALKDRSVAGAITARGGGGHQINQVASNLGNELLGDVANLAGKGDEAAITAIKIVKQAARKAQKYGGKQ
jgi:hypothetical protein